MDNRQKLFDAEVDRLLDLMSNMEPSTDDYKKVVESLKTLCEARSKKPALIIEPETVVTALSSLLGIVLILQHERLNVVTSRAISFVRK